MSFALSIPVFKAFFKRPDTRALVEALKKAKVTAKETRTKVDAYIAPVFEDCGPFPVDPDKLSRRGGPAFVETPDKLYLCSDEARCNAFYAACDRAHKEQGYRLPEGYCPALVAEHAVTKLENALLDHAKACKILPGPIYSLELREKALDLFLNAPEA